MGRLGWDYDARELEHVSNKETKSKKTIQFQDSERKSNWKYQAGTKIRKQIGANCSEDAFHLLMGMTCQSVPGFVLFYRSAVYQPDVGIKTINFGYTLPFRRVGAIMVLNPTSRIIQIVHGGCPNIFTTTNVTNAPPLNSGVIYVEKWLWRGSPRPHHIIIITTIWFHMPFVACSLSILALAFVFPLSVGYLANGFCLAAWLLGSCFTFGADNGGTNNHVILSWDGFTFRYDHRETRFQSNCQTFVFARWDTRSLHCLVPVIVKQLDPLHFFFVIRFHRTSNVCWQWRPGNWKGGYHWISPWFNAYVKEACITWYNMVL